MRGTGHRGAGKCPSPTAHNARSRGMTSQDTGAPDIAALSRSYGGGFRPLRMLIAVTMAAGVLVAAGPASGDVSTLAAGSCTSWSSRTTPPTHIRVFRLHRRGSPIPARVEVWGFRNYVGMVMRSGAWPGRPRASAIVGAIAIKQYAWWMVLHHQPGHSFRGRCYDITDSEQYLRPDARPGDRVPTRTASAVRASWGISVRKNGRLIRTGWSGEGGRCGQVVDRWHLLEDGVTDCARRLGYGYRRILRIYLSPVDIRGSLQP